MLVNDHVDRNTTKAYLVGGGLASLAAAAFLIRDGEISGRNITIFEERSCLGGGLECNGNATDGYILRGGRILDRKFLCMYDLFSTIPTLDGSKPVTQEIFECNNTTESASELRLVKNNLEEAAPEFGLNEKHILTIERLVLEPESMLGKTSIQNQFDPTFFDTDFWLMWSSTFSFQPWHSAVEFKRYLVRFNHIIGSPFHTQGILKTEFNQYDSLIRPLKKWLDERGVTFELNTCVIDIDIIDYDGEKTASNLVLSHSGTSEEISVSPNDIVLITLGSMAEDTSFGSMDTAPSLNRKIGGDAWTLWRKMAAGRPEFGRPTVFADHSAESGTMSFTTTVKDPATLLLMHTKSCALSSDAGFTLFLRSNWLASIVIPRQPCFPDQPSDVGVFGGVGIALDRKGNYINKTMMTCTGREIMTEILGHLGLEEETRDILSSCLCLPCFMPFAASPFLRRKKGDRPRVIPLGSKNIAIIGQFCELPDDAALTLEYSIRSAQTAAYALLGVKREPPAVYKSKFNPRVLYKSFMALHEFSSFKDVI